MTATMENKPTLPQPLGDYSSELMKLLRDKRSVKDRSGHVRSRIDEQTNIPKNSIGAAVKSLQSNGLVKTETQGRRTYSITLTEKGRKVADNLNDYLPTRSLIWDVLCHEGCIGQPVDDKGTATEDPVEILATGVRRNADRVREAIVQLEQKGCVVVHRNNKRRITNVEMPTYDEAFRQKNDEPEEEPINNNGETTSGEGLMVDEPRPPAYKLPEYKQHPDEYSPEEAPESFHDEPVEQPDEPQRGPGPREILARSELSDYELTTALSERLAQRSEEIAKLTREAEQAGQDTERTQEVLGWIREAVQSVNSGHSSPLKAMGDVETALNLLEGS